MTASTRPRQLDRSRWRLTNRALLVDLIDRRDLSEREVARRASLGHATLNHLLTRRRETCCTVTAVAISTALGVGHQDLFTSISP